MRGDSRPHPERVGADVELVEFWATGNRAAERCHRAVTEFASRAPADVAITCYDAWDAPLETAQHRVLSLPTVILRAGDVELARWTSRPPTTQQIADWVAAHRPAEDRRPGLVLVD